MGLERISYEFPKIERIKGKQNRADPKFNIGADDDLRKRVDPYQDDLLPTQQRIKKAEQAKQ